MGTGHSKQWRAWYILLTLGVAVSLVLTACAPAATGPTATPTKAAAAAAPTTSAGSAAPAASPQTKANTCASPIKVGMLFSQTGGYATIGKEATNGAQLALGEVQAAGGINGCPVQVVQYDTASNPDTTVTMAKRLIQQDQVVAIIGPEVAGLHAAIAGLATQAKIPVFNTSGGLSILDPTDQAWGFTTTPSPPLVHSVFMPFLASLKVGKYGYLSTPDAVGNHMAGLIKDLGDALGMVQVGDEREPANATDLTPALSKLKAQGPQGLVIVGSGQWADIALNNAAQVGLDVPTGLAGGYSWEDFKKSLTPEAVKNLYVGAPKIEGFGQLKADDPANAVIGKFVDAYKAKYGGQSPEDFSAYGYDITKLLIMSLTAVGPDAQKLRDYAQNVKNFMGVSGTVFNYSPENHIGASVQDGIIMHMEGNDVKLKSYISDVLKGLSPDQLKGLDQLKTKRPSEL